ncbi:M48 family metalloprotease [Rhizobium laguerreae]|uniref:M48 family metalloprotease n=1 Tax=Rhizobium laguerreae TaxID=1076926 RepID=UPI001C929BA7|nr:M48 family metalloprotease [Rhizobium laguerreae]MBY3182757.1 M48 family metalloprotease [Rhizobium laguerreae]
MLAPGNTMWRWRTLILFTRMELFLWLCASVPYLFLMIVIIPHALVYSGDFVSFPIIFVSGTIAFVFACGFAFETLRGRLLFPKAVAVPPELKSSVDEILSGFLRPVGFRFRSGRVRVIMTDLSIGAHVRGVIRPRIYVSGALLINLLEGNNAARAILAHELAHIYNHDRWLPGIVTVAFISIGLNLTEFAFGRIPFLSDNVIPTLFGEHVALSTKRLFLATNAIILTAVCSFMLHRREYAADFVGAMMLRSRQNYADFLQKLRGNIDVRSDIEKVPLYVMNHYVTHAKFATDMDDEEVHVIGPTSDCKTFTHPALKARIDAISGKRVAIGPSGVLTAFWLLMLGQYTLTFVPIIQWINQNGFSRETLQDIVLSSDMLLLASGTGLLAIVGLTVELIRFAILASN